MTPSPAPVFCQCGCGRVVIQARMGGPRKRFFENACRARWNRRGKRTEPEPASSTGADERQATLQWIYEGLKADITERGLVIGGKPNPTIEVLRRIIVELDRRTPPAATQEREDEPVDLIAI